MDENDVAQVQHDRQPLEPGDQSITIPRVQDVPRCLESSPRRSTCRHLQEMEIMVPENCSRAELSNQTNDGSAAGAPVHHVPTQEQPILALLEFDGFEEPHQGLETTLNITYEYPPGPGHSTNPASCSTA